MISSPEDWAEVYALRAQCDAIIIGGGTLRSDNPTLTLKSEELIKGRISRGREAEPARVIISGRGEISPELRIFSRGAGRVIIFSNEERSELSEVAEVIVADSISAPFIVGELERRALYDLFVEGGAVIHTLFFDSRMVDRVRVASNPAIVVGDSSAPRFTLPQWVAECDVERDVLGGVEVDRYLINSDLSSEDRGYMQMAIDCSRSSPKSEGCYSVGAVIVTPQGEIFTGYTGEDNPLYHAEQAAINKAEAAAGVELKGATIYSSIEPCSQRSRQPKSCSQLLIERGFAKVCFALYEPSNFVVCRGAEIMREAGIRVCVMADYIDQVVAINGHLLKK